VQVDLVQVAPCRGIYGPSKDSLPARMRWLHPAASEAFDRIRDIVAVSDMFRSPEASLKAMREGRGAAAPGRSSHNYGRAIDIDVPWSLRLLGCGKEQLDDLLAERGWWCWREDHELAKESWHYFFSPTPVKYTWDPYAKCVSAVAWWSREMTRLYPAKDRTLEYVQWHEAWRKKAA